MSPIRLTLRHWQFPPIRFASSRFRAYAVANSARLSFATSLGGGCISRSPCFFPTSIPPEGGGFIHALRSSLSVRSEIALSHLPLSGPQHGTQNYALGCPPDFSLDGLTKALAVHTFDAGEVSLVVPAHLPDFLQKVCSTDSVHN